MLMTFSFRENMDDFEPINSFEIETSSLIRPKQTDEKIHIFAEKLQIPTIDEYISRPRIDELLGKSLNQIGAVMINGRAGAGKTALAVNFSKNYDETVWLQVESADSDWKVFSSYLKEGLKTNPHEDVSDVPFFVESIFTEKTNQHTPRLIVFDDVHNIFDAEWFNDFFQTALYSHTPETHLVFLSRSKPAFPLWRLRSKQVLSVIDEKILAFDNNEAKKFCDKFNLSAREKTKICKESYGRIGKIKVLAELMTH